MAHRGERAFDDVRGAQMLPVLGREVVSRAPRSGAGAAGLSLYVREDENARDEDVYDNRVLERVLIPRVFIRF